MTSSPIFQDSWEEPAGSPLGRFVQPSVKLPAQWPRREFTPVVRKPLPNYKNEGTNLVLDDTLTHARES